MMGVLSTFFSLIGLRDATQEEQIVAAAFDVLSADLKRMINFVRENNILAAKKVVFGAEWNKKFAQLQLALRTLESKARGEKGISKQLGLFYFFWMPITGEIAQDFMQRIPRRQKLLSRLLAAERNLDELRKIEASVFIK